MTKAAPERLIQLGMQMSKAELAKIEDWRRLQPEIPSRAQAIRTFVALGMKAAMEATAEKPSPKIKAA